MTRQTKPGDSEMADVIPRCRPVSVFKLFNFVAVGRSSMHLAVVGEEPFGLWRVFNVIVWLRLV